MYRRPKERYSIHAVFVTGPKASLGGNPSVIPGIGHTKVIWRPNNDTETSPTVSNGYERIIMGVMTKKARRWSASGGVDRTKRRGKGKRGRT